MAEVCGEAVPHPEAETVCDQEWKDTATAVLSSQNTADTPEIRPQKEDMEEIKFLFLGVSCLVFMLGLTWHKAFQILIFTTKSLEQLKYIAFT